MKCDKYKKQDNVNKICNVFIFPIVFFPLWVFGINLMKLYFERKCSYLEIHFDDYEFN